MNAPFHQGIFIDIFVMDAVPACDRKKKNLLKKQEIYLLIYAINTNITLTIP